MNKLRWQRKFSALLDWFLLSGIVLVACCSLLKSRLRSVRRRRRRRRSLQQPITVRKPCATCPHPLGGMRFVTFAFHHTIGNGDRYPSPCSIDARPPRITFEASVTLFNISNIVAKLPSCRDSTYNVVICLKTVVPCIAQVEIGVSCTFTIYK